MKKAVKQNNKTGLLNNDVQVECSLPPAVQGQLRCFLVVKVDYIVWKIKNHPKDIQVCLKWWGQVDGGTRFWPCSKKVLSEKLAKRKITALYPVCSGPRQFAAYLHDMGILVLDILHSKTLKPFGKVEIHEIVELSSNNYIDRWFNVTSLSVQPVKFAELHVTLKFESVDVVGQNISLDVPVIDEQFDQMQNTPVKSATDAIAQQIPQKIQEQIPQKKSNVNYNSVKEDTDEDDVITSLIKKGKTLRDSMVESISNIEDDDEHVGATCLLLDEMEKEEPENGNISGGLLRAILKVKDDHEIVASPQVGKLPVDLILEDDINEDMYELSSSLASDSDHSVYDETLLQELFYTNKDQHDVPVLLDDSMNDSCIIMNEEEEEEKVTLPRKYIIMNQEEEKVIVPPKSKELVKEIQANRLVQRTEIPEKADLKQQGILQEQPGSVPIDGDQLSNCGNTSLRHECISDEFLTGLGINKLTALGRVSAARVTINKLNITHQLEGEQVNNRTYFIEYEFPVAASSENSSNEGVALERTRIATKKTTSQSVIFNHHSVFPVLFDSNVTSFWWNYLLTIKILERKSGQKSPIVIGVGAINLKTILASRQLQYDGIINIKSKYKTDRYGTTSLPSSTKPLLGQLELRIDLMSNGKVLHFQVSESEQELENGGTNRRENLKKYVPQSIKETEIVEQQRPKQVHISQKAAAVTPGKPPRSNITLMTLLWISEGRNIIEDGHGFRVSITGEMTRSNFYLISRLFWTHDTSKSTICWGQNDPKFNFKQVSPVLLTSALLDRMHNNFITLEVWNKAGGGRQDDELIGIAKLPLQQLYLSYKNEQTTNALLKSKFPVVAVDGWVKINNPFKSTCQGELRLLLAMGSESQVARLQDIKQFSQEDHVGLLPTGKRSQFDFLQRNIEENQVEHSFEIIVQNVRKLFAFEKTLWGETDCFVQYNFPHQRTSIEANTNDFAHEDIPGLQNHRTSTTLCIPDTTFNDVARYSIVLPQSLPVQRYLLAAYHGSWSSIATAAGITFELWKRHYYPNIRDQLVAKGLLPLAKLCGMITMQKTDEPSVQSFSLPLTTLPSSEEKKDTYGGLLDVTIKYRHSKSQVSQPPPKATTLKENAQVCFSIEINRACGLKCALKKLAESDSSLKYASEVGGNPFIKMKLPFNIKMNERVTRTIARTFTPDFGYRMDFVLPLIFEDLNGLQTSTLAECLENEEVLFEIWHKRSRESYDENIQEVVHGFLRRQFTPTSDVFLGAVKIALRPLLFSHTGISGWFPVSERKSGSERSEFSTNEIENTVGGLEVKINFGDGKEREKIIDSARAIGWSLPVWYEVEHGRWLNDTVENNDINIGQALSLEVTIKSIWIPKLITRAVQLQHGLKENKLLGCYVRYKFYDTKAVFSSVCSLTKMKESDVVLCNMKHSHSYIVKTTSPFIWYMREEKLEIQVWLTSRNGEDKNTLPSKRDKLVGSAFINLFPLLDDHGKHSELSGIHPLFRSSAIDLGGAGLHVRIVLQKPSNFQQVMSYDVDDDVVSTDQTSNINDNDKVSIALESSEEIENKSRNQDDKTSSSHEDEDDDVIAARVIVEQALHLPLIDTNAEKSVPPNVYVTYQPTSDSKVVKTKVILSSISPLWDHEKLIKFRRSEIGKQVVTFKVCHCHNSAETEHSTTTSQADATIGIASVDLSPLASGFRQVIGWYNLADVNGQCNGQIKWRRQNRTLSATSLMLGVIPLLPVSSQSPLSQPQRLSKGFTSKQRMDKISEISTDSLLNEQNVKEGGIQCGVLSNILPTGEQVPHSSKSFLLRQLRQNMSELDIIKQRLRQRLRNGNDERQVDHDSSKINKDHVIDKEELNFEEDLNNIKLVDMNEQATTTNQSSLKEDILINCVQSSLKEDIVLEDDGIFEVINTGKGDNTDKNHHSNDYTNDGNNEDHNQLDEIHKNNDDNVQLKCNDILIINDDSNTDDQDNCNEIKDNQDDLDIDEFLNENTDDKSSTCDEVETNGNDFVAVDESLDSFFDIPTRKCRESTEQLCLSMDDISESVVKRKNLNKLKDVLNKEEKDGPKVHFEEFSHSVKNGDLKKLLSQERGHCSKQINIDDACRDVSDEILDEKTEKDQATSHFHHVPVNYLSSIPNFFMPPKDLEQSMRSLRIAATFRKEPRQNMNGQKQCEEIRNETEKMSGSNQKTVSDSFKNWKQLEKIRSTGQIPLSSKETSRLAKIFSSTYSASN